MVPSAGPQPTVPEILATFGRIRTKLGLANSHLKRQLNDYRTSDWARPIDIGIELLPNLIQAAEQHLTRLGKSIDAHSLVFEEWSQAMDQLKEHTGQSTTSAY
jgi:hypothetical protein